MNTKAIRRQFKVVIANADGSETSTSMKTWLRQHPELTPEGVDVNRDGDNSQYIARKLRDNGWSSRETLEEVLLFPPGSIPPPDSVDDDSDDSEPADEYGSFKMEKELRDFLAHNLNLVKIGEGGLRLYSDQAHIGIEYPTATGPIDILAVDDIGTFYVFELKRAASPDSAIGQLTRYMGWVMRTLANGRPVYGLVVAKEITDRLKYAVLPIPNVKLFEYKVAFALKGVEPLTTESNQFNPEFEKRLSWDDESLKQLVILNRDDKPRESVNRKETD